MLPLTVNGLGYVEIDTEDWLNDFSTVIDTPLANEFGDWSRDQAYPANMYASAESLISFMHSKGYATSGLYGDGEFISIGSTYNGDNFLSDDIGFVLFDWTKGDERGTYLCVVTMGIMNVTPENVEWREMNGEMTDALMYSSGYASHADSNSTCPKEWLIESACILTENGGMDTARIAECIVTPDDAPAYLECPHCKGILVPYSN